MIKNLDLNNPKDAKHFLLKVMPDVIGKPALEFTYSSGKTVQIKDMTDAQLVEAAMWCAPIFQAKYPNNIEIHNEQ